MEKKKKMKKEIVKEKKEEKKNSVQKKINDETVKRIKRDFINGYNIKDISTYHQVSIPNVRAILTLKSRRKVSEDYNQRILMEYEKRKSRG